MAKKKSTVISKGRSPAFQYYPDKYDTHTRHLSDYSYRVYHRIINWMWLHSPDYCSCPTDPSAIAVILAEPTDRITGALSEIQNQHMPLMKKKGKRYISAGLQKEARKQADNSGKAKAAADKRWADAKASKTDADALPTHSGRIDLASSEQCTPSPTPSPIPTPATPKKKEKKASPVSFTEQWMQDDDFKASWNDWAQHRKEIGSKLTPTTITRQVKQMAAMGKPRAISMMDYTIGKGWRGLREPEAGDLPKQTSMAINVGGNRDADGKPIWQG